MKLRLTTKLSMSCVSVSTGLRIALSSSPRLALLVTDWQASGRECCKENLHGAELPMVSPFWAFCVNVFGASV